MNRPFWAASILATVFCVLAIVGTSIGSDGDREIVYVLDVSRSHGPAPPLLLERLRQSHEGGPFAGSRFRVILAGATAIEQGGGIPPSFTEGSRLDLGLELARRTRGSASAIVVFSDGRFDHGPASKQVQALASEGVTVRFEGPLAEPALDMRLVPRGAAAVEGHHARVRVAVTGTNRDARKVVLTLTGAEQPAGGSIVVAPGATEEWEALVLVAPTARSLTVRIGLDEGPDAAPANDEMTVPLTRERLRVLVVGKPAAMVDGLEDLAVDLERLEEVGDLDGNRLAGVDLLVLVDQSVSGVPAATLQEIETAVTEGGLGLWVIGGEHAFGAGAYAATRFDDLLPLSSRAVTARQVTVVLDTSGSMERDGRIGRSIDAITNLAQALTPQDRLQVIPFSQEAAAPVPAAPASPEDFLSTAIPVLRRIAPRGGTRLLPGLDAALAAPRRSDLKEVIIVVTDAQDDQVRPSDLATRRRAMIGGKIDAIVVLLDATDETRVRAEDIATAGVITVTDYGPRILVRVLERDAFAPGEAESILPDGSAGPPIAWRNRVRAGKGALVALRTKEREPLMASAFRGVGRTAAWAAWPARIQEARALAKDCALKTARPPDWKRISARREQGRLVISMPADQVPPGALFARPSGGAGATPLSERAPGVFEARDDFADGGHLTLLAADRIFAVVPVPPAGDPEYAWPAMLPPRGSGPTDGGNARLRAPWAVLATLSWVGAVLLRSRRA